MAHNRGRTHPELALASALWRRGLRYVTSRGYTSRYGQALPGQPDIIFPKKRMVIFVDGCFWHGCQVCNTGVDRSSEFWQTKILANKQRDRRITKQLEKAGWRVVRVLEHDIRTKVSLQNVAEKLTSLLGSLSTEEGD
jgi:DNA mismatch endonuclease (patch repair protein)